MTIARISSISALRKLEGKPHMASEIAHKLSEDVDQGVLVKLSDFLELDEVKSQNIDHTNVDKLVVPSPLHIVGNLGSKSSPVRLVVTPNRVNQSTRQSINSAFHSGLPQLPKMQEILYKYRFSLSFAVADLVAFYKRNILDPVGSLLSAIYLQGGFKIS